MDRCNISVCPRKCLRRYVLRVRLKDGDYRELYVESIGLDNSYGGWILTWFGIHNGYVFLSHVKRIDIEYGWKSLEGL